MPPVATDSSIIYQNSDATISLIDIPRSLELAQGKLWKRRMISTLPLQAPYPSLEPKNVQAKQKLGEQSMDDLILQRYTEIAWGELGDAWSGEWCFPRVTSTKEVAPSDQGQAIQESQRSNLVPLEPLSYHNEQRSVVVLDAVVEGRSFLIPPGATILQGSIASMLPAFKAHAPCFDVILMDPPWPNRSAHRAQKYRVEKGLGDITDLLLSLPITTHLDSHGMLAIWITNKKAIRDLLLDPSGLFDQWGVQLVEEWVWTKVTVSGEPMVEFTSRWRKPWEILLVAQKKHRALSHDVRKRFFFAVPDLHSRKPSFAKLLEDCWRQDSDAKLIRGLEIFARNATAGWWSWGDEALMFQREDCWAFA